MGEAKRRKILDPYFGKTNLLKLLIEKDELYEKPKNIYLEAFVLLDLMPIVIIDSVNYNKTAVTGIQSKDDFPQYLNKYKEEVYSKDFSEEKVLIISAGVGYSLIIPVKNDELAQSLAWANDKDLTLKTADLFDPKRIANYDTDG